MTTQSYEVRGMLLGESQCAPSFFLASLAILTRMKVGRAETPGLRVESFATNVAPLLPVVRIFQVMETVVAVTSSARKTIWLRSSLCVSAT